MANKESNSYIMTYAVAMTLIFGSLLAVVALVLKEKQAFNKELERKTYILSSGLGADQLAGMKPQEVSDLYDNNVEVKVFDATGKDLGELDPKFNLQKQYKNKDNRQLPVYIVKDKKDPSKKSYVFPVYGNGLWDYIWGYLAIEGDLNTVKGIVFDHVGETPGLGARITDKEVQDRFKNKKIFNSKGELSPPHFQKGEGNDFSKDAHKVDGLSGATITAKGVNKMFDSYLDQYLPFIKANKT